MRKYRGHRRIPLFVNEGVESIQPSKPSAKEGVASVVMPPALKDGETFCKREKYARALENAYFSMGLHGLGYYKDIEEVDGEEEASNDISFSVSSSSVVQKPYCSFTPHQERMIQQWRVDYLDVLRQNEGAHGCRNIVSLSVYDAAPPISLPKGILDSTLSLPAIKDGDNALRAATLRSKKDAVPAKSSSSSSSSASSLSSSSSSSSSLSSKSRAKRISKAAAPVRITKKLSLEAFSCVKLPSFVSRTAVPYSAFPEKHGVGEGNLLVESLTKARLTPLDSTEGYYAELYSQPVRAGTGAA
jgi:hypothetical protein